MKRNIALIIAVFASIIAAHGQNTVNFDNQSGEPALVKIVGPTTTEVEVPSSAKKGADVIAGDYTIKVRYGAPGNYRYTQGEKFAVTQTATARSIVTITLHKVVAGNYESQPISETEFSEAPSLSTHQGKSEAKPEKVQDLMTLVTQTSGNTPSGRNFDVFLAGVGQKGKILQAVYGVVEDHSDAKAMSELAHTVAEKQGSSKGEDKVVYDNALWAFDCFCDTDEDVARVRQALQKHCDSHIAQKAIAELDVMYRKRIQQGQDAKK
jgi:hypothetical protein